MGGVQHSGGGTALDQVGVLLKAPDTLHKLLGERRRSSPQFSKSVGRMVAKESEAKVLTKDLSKVRAMTLDFDQLQLERPEAEIGPVP